MAADPDRPVEAQSRGGRLALAAAVSATAAVALPFALGGGVDQPDDALLYSVSGWEWLRYAWTEGVSPWFMTGKLGGISLFADVIPMGPHYPATWVLRVLPVWLAMPLVAWGHAVGTVLAVAWAARVHGASRATSALAGAAIGAGPLLAVAFIDCQYDVYALYLFMPVVLGAQARLEDAEDRATSARYAALLAAALALMTLGSHIRYLCGAWAGWALYVVIRRKRLAWVAGAAAVGLLAGAPGFLPYAAQLPLVGDRLDRLDALAGPVWESFTPLHLAGWLTPQVAWFERDFSPGLALGWCFLVGAGRATGRLRALAQWAALLLLAAVSAELPLLRWPFAPLLVFTHPVNLFYAALALFPAVIVAAWGAGLVAAEGVPALRARGLAGAAQIGLLLAVVVRTARAETLLPIASVAEAFRVGVGIAGAVAVIAILALRARRPALLFGLALLDIVVIDARLHLARPSYALNLRERQDVDREALSDGFLSMLDLRYTHAFEYGAEGAGMPPEDNPFEDGANDAIRLLTEPVPVHVGMGTGLRGIAGAARLPDARSVRPLDVLRQTLEPTPQRALRRAPAHDDARLDEAFREAGFGRGVLLRYGGRVVVSGGRTLRDVGDPLPPCWSPVRVERFEPNAWQSVIGRADTDVAGVEGAIPPPAAVARIARCPDPAGELDVQADGDAIVVLRQRFHPGWRVSLDGARVPTFPVDSVHLGFRVPAGTHRGEARFVPPGLRPAQVVAAAGWLMLLSGGTATWRRRGATR